MKPGSGKRRFLLALCLLATLLFTGLAIWQVERRAWKLDLIERVNARVHAAPVPVRSAAAWDRLDTSRVEYRRVVARGRFLHDRETLVDALTERGPGFWVITPLLTERGAILVNRGFVPPERRLPATRPQGQVSGTVSVVGLLRLSEPGGRFLRANQPARDRWFSRDVAAIAARRGVERAAPFFIDADATANPGGLPVGGLTVINFRNAHLVYALTWLALAGMCLAGFVLIARTTQEPA